MSCFEKTKPILDKMTVLGADGLRLPQSLRSFAMTLVGYLKKQSQFSKRQNERKVNYNKGIREIYWIGHLVKTNPIKANLIGANDGLSFL
jgi:hypothetical protein